MSGGFDRWDKATFCALWAIYARRSPVGWFTARLSFTVLTSIAVLYTALRYRQPQLTSRIQSACRVR